MAAFHPMNPEHIHEKLELMGPVLASYNYEWLSYSPRWRGYYLSHDQTFCQGLWRAVRLGWMPNLEMATSTTMAWLSRLRRRARVLRSMQTTRASSARSIAGFWLRPAWNGSLNLARQSLYPLWTRSAILGNLSRIKADEYWERTGLSGS